MRAALHHGDNIAILKREIANASVDLVYLDPPFLTQQHWTGTAGSFSDRWRWNRDSEDGLASLSAHHLLAGFIRSTWGRGDQAAYFVAMAQLFIELRRVLRLTGTIWCHADDSAIHGLRILLDLIFGPQLALGIVIWKRTSAHANRKGYGRVHDTIACSARSRAARWRLWRIGRERDRAADTWVHGDPLDTFFVEGFCEDRLTPTNNERVGYPTQKPIALLERVILCASRRGDVVLDPVCGSGTALVAALKHGRRAVGIDRSEDAIAAATARLSHDTRKLRAKYLQPRLSDPAQESLL